MRTQLVGIARPLFVPWMHVLQPMIDDDLSETESYLRKKVRIPLWRTQGAHTFALPRTAYPLHIYAMSSSLDSRHCIRQHYFRFHHTFTMAQYTAFPLLQQLESTLVMSPPYCSSILEAPHEAFKLYYGQKNARCVVDGLQTRTRQSH